MKFDINKVKRGVHMGLLFVKSHSSEIEAVAGGLCVVGGTVLLIKNAEAIADVNAEVKNDKQFKQEVEESGSWEEQGETKTHYILRTTKKHACGYIQTTWKGVALTGAGLGLMALSNVTIHKQLEAVSASLAATTLSYNQYRQRVIEDQGEEKDYEYFTGGVMKTVEMKPDGTVIETTTPINTDNQVFVPHSFFFDSRNRNWSKNAVHNKTYLEQCLYYVNKRLAMEGFLTENDIRDIVGEERTIAGQAAGVFYQNEDGSINNVSFGIEDNNPAAQSFRDGTNPDFLVTIKYADGRPICDNCFPRLQQLGFWSQI